MFLFSLEIMIKQRIQHILMLLIICKDKDAITN